MDNVNNFVKKLLRKNRKKVVRCFLKMLPLAKNTHILHKQSIRLNQFLLINSVPLIYSMR
jgi:hypothetical protein